MVKKKIYATYMIPVQVNVSYEVEAKTSAALERKLKKLKASAKIPIQAKNVKYSVDEVTHPEDIAQAISDRQEKCLAFNDSEDC